MAAEPTIEAAEAVGRAMVPRGWGLVYGGGRVGLMGTLARGVKAAGGRVVGVIPEFMKASGNWNFARPTNLVTGSRRWPSGSRR